MIWDDSIDKKDWLINSGMWGFWDYETYKNVNHYDVIIVNRPKGYYSVSIHLMFWDEEPGAYWKNGKTRIDFVVLLKYHADEKQT